MTDETEAQAVGGADKAPTGRTHPDKVLIVDTNAHPDQPSADGTKTIKGSRVHEMMIDGRKRAFVFEHGVPLAVEWPVAIRFLRDEAFRLVDENGEELPFQRTPKQPHELEAGQQFRLGDEETVARYEELHDEALRLRAMQIPGGERFGRSTNRDAMVEFIMSANASRRRENTARPPSDEEFTPDEEWFTAAA
jgi:hypothetical protein